MTAADLDQLWQDYGRLSRSRARLPRGLRLPAMARADWCRAYGELTQTEALALLARLPVRDGWLLRLGDKPELERADLPWEAEDRRKLLAGELLLAGGTALHLALAPRGLVGLTAIWAGATRTRGRRVEQPPAELGAALGADASPVPVMVQVVRRPGVLMGEAVWLAHEVAFAVLDAAADTPELTLHGVVEPWASRLRRIGSRDEQWGTP